MERKNKHILWYTLLGSYEPSSQKTLNKLIYQSDMCFRKNDHQDSILWLSMDDPYQKLFCPEKLSQWCCLRYIWIPPTTVFSYPLPERIIVGKSLSFPVQLMKYDDTTFGSLLL